MRFSRWIGAFGVLVAVAMAFGATQVSRAATFTVTNTNDSGAGSLRQAILDANSTAGQDTISITATGTITLASNLPLVLDAVIIVGPGSTQLTISNKCGAPCNSSGIFFSAPATASGFTITTNSIGLGTGAPLTLTDIVSTNNRDAGIAITGGVTATITNSRVTNNGFGGSVVLGAGLQITGGSNVTVNNSVVSGNTNSGDGGGAWINGGSLTINNSTFSGNSSGATGGGIFLFQQAASAPVVNVNESTISGNNATRAGAGIEINTNGTVNLRNATISGNTVAPTGVSGGGI